MVFCLWYLYCICVVISVIVVFVVAGDYAYVLLNFQFDSKIQSEKTEMKALTMECDSQNNWNILLGKACHHFCVAISASTTATATIQCTRVKMLIVFIRTNTCPKLLSQIFIINNERARLQRNTNTDTDELSLLAIWMPMIGIFTIAQILW